jgi:hypothetical protein
MCSAIISLYERHMSYSAMKGNQELGGLSGLRLRGLANFGNSANLGRPLWRWFPLALEVCLFRNSLTCVVPTW